MQNIVLVLAALVGAGLAIQAAVNNQLRAATGSALWAAIISSTLTVILFTLAQLGAREPVDTGRLGSYPWWIWIGGFMGAAYVFGVIVFTRHLGVVLVFAAIVSGQLVAGLLIDHYGWFRTPLVPLSPTRIGGVVLLVAGMILIRWR